MSPRPGGEADKVGNRYEGAWAIRHALYCILEPACTLTTEDIDDQLGHGSEFTYVRDGVTEVHQLKRQHRNNNFWSISSLTGMGIFEAAANHVAAGRKYHFVSLIPCGPLRELADRARKSADLAAFTQVWLTKELRNAFDELAAPSVLGNPQAAWITLRGTWFEVHDEGDVIRINSMLAGLSLEGTTGHLISLAIGDVLLDNLGRRLTGIDLLRELKQHRIVPLAARSRASAHEQVEATTDSWCGTVRRELLQPSIKRPEVAHLAKSLETNRIGLVVGTAGGGKSSVLEQTVGSLRASGAKVLALRLDRLEPFASTVELGRQLGFNTSPAAALALARDGRDAYLVIDQLDAVSLASGRMPRSFDVVVDLIGEALSVAGVRVILACREFDVENDHRIRALAGRSDLCRVRIDLLAVETVQDAVVNMGLDPARLTVTQLALLQTPMHLVLLSSIAGQNDALSFQSRGSLFAAFWERKRQSAKARRYGVRFNDVLARIANAASDRQVLSVPVEILDEGDLLDDANVLISEHVLARDGGRIAFFHETFFDYAFARQWVSRGDSLVEFLLRDEQELFRRAQVRQILQHLHEGEPERFLQELEALITSADIRFHIKETAIVAFANLPAPTTAEVHLALRLAANQPSWESWLWLQIRRPQWFKKFHEEGLIAAWLDSKNDDLKARAVGFMVSGAKENGNDVADLLEARQAVPEYLGWLRRILQFSDIHSCRRLFELLLAAARDGAYDETEQDLWLTVHELALNRPNWAIELLKARFVDHRHSLALDADGKVEALTVREYGASELVRQAATAEPRAFVETIVPYLLTVMAAAESEPRADTPLGDKHFSYRFPDSGSDDRELDDALLNATTRALETLVRSDSESARPIMDVLAADPHDAAQFMLYRALTAGGGTFANWAAELLLQGARRLYCGYMSDGYWVARELVEAVAPHVDDAIHQRLENHFIDLRNSYEQRSNFGWTAFNFLSALDKGRLRPKGVRRLQEYQRKFDRDSPAAPRGIEGGMITSPIEAGAATKMTDAQWLNAMAKYDKGDHDWTSLKGGASELANQLRVQVASNPDRFARLALLMTADLNPAYGDAVLMGFGDASTSADSSSIFAAIRHIASWRHADNDRWLGRALSLRLREVPLDIVELLLDRALRSTDPSEDKPATTIRRTEDDRQADSLRMEGINTARGSLAETLGDLLIYDADGQRTELIRPHLDRLADDPALSVRACVAHTIAASLRHARPTAYAAFERLIEASDVLLAVDLVQQLILYIGNVNPEVIDPVIQRMLTSEDDEAREAGGQLAAFAALEWERPGLLVQAIGAGPTVRLGAARSCAARVVHTSNTELVTSALLRLFNDENTEVAKAAAQVAPNLRERALRSFAALLEALIGSLSYAHAMPQLLITLLHAPDKVDDLALKAAQRFLLIYPRDAGNRAPAAGSARYISKLVVRGLAQSRDQAHRATLLDVLDDLLELGVYGINESIADSERL